MRPHVLVVGTCLSIACGTDTATPDATEVDSVAPDTIVEADVAAGADAADASETDAAERDVTDTNDAAVEVADPPKVVRILAFNDFHGAVEGGPGPGVVYLADAIASLRTDATAVVSAGDLIGGSPLMSGYYHDEPTIEVMNAIGLDYAGVGNHEFDEGATELLRMQNGGCHPVDGCKLGESFAGAAFPFLGANVSYKTGEPLLPGYVIADLGGVDVAFVGMTLEDTAAVTLTSAVTDLAFADEVDTMNALVPELKAAGADVIVLLLHEGGNQFGPPNGCLSLIGNIVGIANALDPAVSVIVSGHTHAVYNCRVGDRLVTSAGSNGSFLTVIDLAVDPTSGAVTATAENVTISNSRSPDPVVADLVAGYDALISELRNEIIATISDDITNAANFAGELPMGSVIADAMLAATRAPALAGAEVALMNGGGVRAGLDFEPSGDETEPGQVTYGEAFTVQPFSNLVSTISVTGADLALALESWASSDKPLQVAGLSYVWNRGAPAEEVSSILIAGEPLDADRVYRVTVNSIVGDPNNTPSFERATEIDGIGVDLDLLVPYLRDHSPLAPPTDPRIRLP